jgi:hypothetical protein
MREMMCGDISRQSLWCGISLLEALAAPRAITLLSPISNNLRLMTDKTDGNLISLNKDA